MGNGFKACLVFGSALLWCAACGSDSDEGTGNPTPEYVGPLPTNQDPAIPSGMTPSGQTPTDGTPAPDPANPTPTPNSETPAGSDAPLDTPPQGTDGTSMTPTPPSDQTPPDQSPPDQTPPGDQTPPPSEPAPTARTSVFVLFGQSNMFGVPAPEGQDLPATDGAEVLTLQACNAHGANQWVPAQPPLHGCVGQPSNSDFGPGLGPGDYFAKVVTQAFPDDTILLVPNAIAGVSIDTFAPGAQAYNSMVSRARMAQERGEIRGILFHQGEADTGSPTWVQRVATVVSRLRSDLGVGEGVPFIAGELPYDGCCGSGHNGLVNQLPNSIPNTVVVSAQGLSTYPERSGQFAGTRLHFDVASQRELGRRYANAFLQIAGD